MAIIALLVYQDLYHTTSIFAWFVYVPLMHDDTVLGQLVFKQLKLLLCTQSEGNVFNSREEAIACEITLCMYFLATSFFFVFFLHYGMSTSCHV